MKDKKTVLTLLKMQKHVKNRKEIYYNLKHLSNNNLYRGLKRSILKQILSNPNETHLRSGVDRAIWNN